jgi:hypothetical protein
MSLDSLFSNNLIKKAVFGKLENWAKENHVRTIVLKIGADGKITEPDFFTAETVTITKDEFLKIIQNQKTDV